MRLGLSVATEAAEDTDVVIEVEDDAEVAALTSAVGAAVGLQPDGLWLGGTRLAADALVAETALREGSVVALGAACANDGFHAPTRGWVLHVTTGLDAGAMIELPIGDLEIGRTAAFPVRDRAVSRRHAVLRVTPDGAGVLDLASSNGTTVDGVPVAIVGPESQPTPVVPGQVIGIGDTLMVIATASPSDAAVEAGLGGELDLNRPPRMLPSSRAVKVAMPEQPVARPPRKFPLLTILAPVGLGVVMALFLNPLYLLFTLMSPLMMGGNLISDRRQGAKDNRQAKADYDAALIVANDTLARSLIDETARRRDEHPNPSDLVRIATVPTRRLWERRRSDPDALTIRFGTADLPSRVLLTRRTGEDEHRTVYSVPATLALRDVGVLGVAGPADTVHGVARWLLLQLAVMHAPRDLSITLLAPRPGGEWEFIRWLPHARPGDPEAATISVGNDTDTVAARVSDAVALIKARQAALGSARVDRSAFPAHVVVLDGARELRAVRGVASMLADGPDVGVFALCIDFEERLLPEECQATLVVDSDDASRIALHRTGQDRLDDVLTEQVSPTIAMAVARAVAPMRDVSHDESEASLPESARLLDILGIEPPTVDSVRARWQLDGRTTNIPIGVGTDGGFTLDLRRDGPHGLIAGTTGAGKSELLQSIIASLAVGNRPDSLNFVLIDYKGGSAFKDCVALPHTVGMVTDLDAHLVERALTSLGAELKRREHQLADSAVKDLEDYDDLQRKDPSLPSMPRLLLVIDEFASMARELPEFVTGLVSIAQRGRSLGIHLLLATQRPSGVVSPEIRANTNLRVCLRVTDGADSADVIEAADAARIPKSAPGRAYARLGHGALLPFQAGRIGGRRPGTKSVIVRAPFVAPLSWRQLGYPPPRPMVTAVADDVEVTDLSVLVSAICDAASVENLAEQRRPWLAALPEQLLLSDLPEPVASGDLPAAPFALADLPELQRQQPLALDLTRDGHLLVVGSPRSGRSQLLRTVIGGAADRISCDDLHVYGIDCGNGALLPLAELPHTGAIVSRTQTERAARLLARLLGELERRQATLAEHGHADISEQRAASPADQRLPHLLVVIDRWEGFTSTLGELDNGRLTDAVLALLREGASTGIHVIITGDRSLASGRISSLTDNKLALRIADRGDYTLLGLNARKLPDDIPPGRVFAADTAAESQVAMLSADASGQGQAAAIAAIASRAKARDDGVPRSRRAFRVDVLPGRISFEQAWEMRDAGRQGLPVLVGVGGDDLAALGPDLAHTAAFVVGGPNKSGRSTVLTTMVTSVLREGAMVVIGAPRQSPIRELASHEGVIEVITDAMTDAARWAEVIDKAGERPLVVALDDAESLKDSPAGELFRGIIKGLTPGRSMILCGHLDGICTGLSGWQVDARKARQGVLLSPQSTTDGDLIGVRLPRSIAGGAPVPGRGYLHLGDGRLISIATPAL